MIRVYYANIKDYDLSIADSFPIQLKKEVFKYKFEADQLRCALGKFLLKSAFKSDDTLDLPASQRKAGLPAAQGKAGREVLTFIKRDANNKPYLPDSNIHFNISHSGDFVVCAVSSSKIGIDIEQEKPIDLADYDIVLNAPDYDFLNAFDNKMPAFFKIWSIKEAIMKADGRGMGIEPKDIYPDYAGLSCQFEDCRWFIQKIEIGLGYACYLATVGEEVSELVRVSD